MGRFAVRALVGLGLLWMTAGCRASAPAASPAQTPALTPTSQADSPAAVAARDSLAPRILGVSREPSRIVYQLAQPSFVTIILVTPTAIEAIAPVEGAPLKLIEAGAHVSDLIRLDSARFGVADRHPNTGAPMLDDIASAVKVQEYNRCLANARAADAQRRQASRPIVGRDSAGRPIYGQAAPTPPSEESERYCKEPASPAASASGRTQTAVKGRYLLLFASNAPIPLRDVLALTISEGDPAAITEAIGRRLFGLRGAQWAGTFVPW